MNRSVDLLKVSWQFLPWGNCWTSNDRLLYFVKTKVVNKSNCVDVVQRKTVEIPQCATFLLLFEGSQCIPQVSIANFRIRCLKIFPKLNVFPMLCLNVTDNSPWVMTNIMTSLVQGACTYPYWRVLFLLELVYLLFYIRPSHLVLFLPVLWALCPRCSDRYYLHPLKKPSCKHTRMLNRLRIFLLAH